MENTTCVRWVGKILYSCWYVSRTATVEKQWGKPFGAKLFWRARMSKFILVDCDITSAFDITYLPLRKPCESYSHVLTYLLLGGFLSYRSSWHQKHTSSEFDLHYCADLPITAFTKIAASASLIPGLWPHQVSLHRERLAGIHWLSSVKFFNLWSALANCSPLAQELTYWLDFVKSPYGAGS